MRIPAPSLPKPCCVPYSVRRGENSIQQRSRASKRLKRKGEAVVLISEIKSCLTERAERDAEDEKGDGVGDAGAAEEVAGGDAQHQRHPDEEHRVVRLGLTHSPSLSSMDRMNYCNKRRGGAPSTGSLSSPLLSSAMVV